MLGAKGGSPSSFPSYFRKHYRGSDKYVEMLNSDLEILKRAKNTVDRMPAVLMQDDLAMSVVLLVFNYNQTRREPWFRFRRADACYEVVHPHLQRLFQQGDKAMKHENVHSKLDNDVKVKPDANLLNEILERNKQDHELFEYASQKHRQQLKAMQDQLCSTW